MSKIKTFFVIAMCVLIAGCYIQSLNPLYTNETLSFDTELIGDWYAPEDEDAVWTFEKANENEYALIGKLKDGDKIKEARFEAFLVRLKDHLFLDIYPTEIESIPDIYREHLIPVHSFLRVRCEGDILVTESLDFGTFNNTITQEETTIPHIRLEGRILITASTDELQKFILNYVDRENVFLNPDTLFRKK